MTFVLYLDPQDRRSLVVPWLQSRDSQRSHELPYLGEGGEGGRGASIIVDLLFRRSIPRPSCATISSQVRNNFELLIKTW
jgi:hypothetical protein